MKKDVVIIGAGPAGIFTALEMLRKGSRQSIPPLPESEDRPLHELQAILPHYYGLFRRGRVF